MTSQPVVELARLMHSILLPEARDGKESRVLHVDFARGGPQQSLAVSRGREPDKEAQHSTPVEA
eukprot:15438153-Alexandrium_andersonii.AAC.1